MTSAIEALRQLGEASEDVLECVNRGDSLSLLQSLG